METLGENLEQTYRNAQSGNIANNIAELILDSTILAVFTEAFPNQELIVIDSDTNRGLLSGDPEFIEEYLPISDGIYIDGDAQWYVMYQDNKKVAEVIQSARGAIHLSWSAFGASGSVTIRTERS